MKIKAWWLHFESSIGKKISYESGCAYGSVDSCGDMIKDCDCDYMDSEIKQAEEEWKKLDQK